MAETGSVRLGETTIPYSVFRSTRRKKTIEVTLDPVEGVLVSAPVAAAAELVEKFVQRRARWIVRKGTERVLRPRPKQFVSGESLPYLGRQVRMFLEPSGAQKVSVAFDHWSFRVQAPDGLAGESRRAAIEKAFRAWYRGRAQARLEARVARWASIAGMGVPEVLTRDQRQRWGSCSPDGVIRFNWRIVMAEPTLMDYVIVHELVHLKVRDHSRRFWDEVGRLMPDYRLRRVRLREFGEQVVM